MPSGLYYGSMDKLVRPPVQAVARLAVVVAAILGAVLPLCAHAVLVKSTPTANSTLSQSTVKVELTFNSRVDPARSQLILISPDRRRTKIALDSEKSADSLASQAVNLKPGAYKVEWQVLAVDGHITRGVIPFTVKPQ